jgi:hypothetical protein
MVWCLIKHRDNFAFSSPTVLAEGDFQERNRNL